MSTLSYWYMGGVFFSRVRKIVKGKLGECLVIARDYALFILIQARGPCRDDDPVKYGGARGDRGQRAKLNQLLY